MLQAILFSLHTNKQRNIAKGSKQQFIMHTPSFRQGASMNDVDSMGEGRGHPKVD